MSVARLLTFLTRDTPARAAGPETDTGSGARRVRLAFCRGPCSWLVDCSTEIGRCSYCEKWVAILLNSSARTPSLAERAVCLRATERLLDGIGRVPTLHSITGRCSQRLLAIFRPLPRASSDERDANRIDDPSECRAL